jgi:predicted metallopeptidase
MEYIDAPDIRQKMEHIVQTVGMEHVDLTRVACYRSKGSSTRRIIARCHGLPKVMQLGLNTRAFYVIEMISERFDRMSPDDQTEVLIHELMHIPKNFGGGFRQHDFVCRREVQKVHKLYKQKCNPEAGNGSVLDQLKTAFKMNDAER